MERVTIIGGGLAGCEAAIAAARRGAPVLLFEMKPERFSPAHKSPLLAELVCSNSLGSVQENSASGLLKDEMRILGSVVMEAADSSRVPAGHALAVDRNVFAAAITASIEKNPLIVIERREIGRIPENGIVIVASGPLTSPDLAEDLAARIGAPSLYFYDAISPIVSAESVDMGIAWKASRYNKGGADYLNLPLDDEQYHKFVAALLAAETVPYRDFEAASVFEGCMPIEEMAARGPETLAFGPMKPVGLVNPRTGKTPYAVVQLRAENAEGALYNIVGFQTKLKQGEQDRILRMIPGLENAEFVRWGSLHRNTYLNAPAVLTRSQELKSDPRILLAGQLVGVEGYLESSASGIIAGMTAARKLSGMSLDVPPPTTIIGALLRRIETADPKHYTPMNANWGILAAPDEKVKKHERRAWQRNRAIEDMKRYMQAAAGNFPKSV